MPDREKVIKRLGKVSYYFKSLLAVGWQGDADTYREHMESVNMAIELLKEQGTIVRCKDCKYWHDPINCQLESEGLKTPDNWFCADGKEVKWNGH